MKPYVAVEIDGVLSPYGGPLPTGYALHNADAAAWRKWAATVYPPPRRLQLALNPTVGRALADLPADLVLVSSCSSAELEPLLLALGWAQLPPMVPLPWTADVHYLRVDDPGWSPDAASHLRWRVEEILGWARKHDRPVAWVRAGNHHQEEILYTSTFLSTVGPVLPHAVDPTAGITPADLQRLRSWAEEMYALPEPAPVVPRRCRDCGGRETTVSAGRRVDRVHGRCGSCCECYCPAPTDDAFQPCGHLAREECGSCRCCLRCVGCHCRE